MQIDYVLTEDLEWLAFLHAEKRCDRNQNEFELKHNLSTRSSDISPKMQVFCENNGRINASESQKRSPLMKIVTTPQRYDDEVA